MMTELRRTVAVLRDREDRHDVTRLQDLEGAVLPARQVGLPVALNADRLPPRLPEPVQTAAYRIIKEAVVNVTRHSKATRVDVDVHVRGDTLHLRVADDGPSRCSPGRAGDHAPGFGIVGMRERAESLGGTLTAGPVGDGFVVDARLPVEPSS
jgi:signal transduction histidine kinase